MEDITYKDKNERFNYRVAGLMIHNDRILIMTDGGLPYYYLPGGRVRFFEESKEAIAREISEELGVQISKSNMIWINENFFTDELSKEKFHEICFYYKVEIEKPNYILCHDEFEREEGIKKHFFKWIGLNEIDNYKLYPLFLAKEIMNSSKEIKHLVERKQLKTIAST